jgi:hypothetical protein
MTRLQGMEAEAPPPTTELVMIAYAFVLTAILGGLGLAETKSASAQGLAGEWTRCVAWSGGRAYNIVNGSNNRDRCFQLGRVCTGNPNAQVTYYGSAVVVNAPYERCVAN